MLMYNDKISENKGAKNEENPESLEAVHTHTHTYCLLNKIKKYIDKKSITTILNKI